MPKHFIAIALTIMLIMCCIICNNNDVKSYTNAEETIKYITMYAPEERTIQVPETEIQNYQKVGWFLEPVIRLWYLDEYQDIIYKKDLEAYLDTNYWFIEKPKVNYDDMILLAKVIYAEATEAPSLKLKDRQYVGSVVMNRLQSGCWGDNLSNVVYAPGQYACVGNSKFNSIPPKECLDIAKQLLMGVDFGVPSNVIFQAQFRQGSGVWQTVGVHYYCYK